MDCKRVAMVEKKQNQDLAPPYHFSKKWYKTFTISCLAPPFLKVEKVEKVD